MSTARSMFTDAIEEHLALKKQNAALDAAMPLARYDVGDPLDRFPGGPGRAAAGDAETVVVPDAGGVSADAFMAPGEESTQLFVGPSPEQAMEAATLLEPTAFGDQPMGPFGGGMTPLLSLVEDIDDEVEAPADAFAAADAPADAAADVLRFPGGVGPRDEAADQHTVMQPTAATPPAAPMDTFAEFDAPTGEQPVLVIDTSEPLAPTDGTDRVMDASRAERRRPRPRFFGLGKKKQQESAGDGWFTDGPRDFNWD